jgi:predicted metal-dependent hydrolase
VPTIEDSEFGSIVVRKSSRARAITMRVAPNGSLRVSAPSFTPLFLIKRTITTSRGKLRALVASQRPVLIYQDGDQIGKSHSLLIRDGNAVQVARRGRPITLTKPADIPLSDPEVQDELRSHIISALRREAKGYLPKRLQYLADEYGFTYSNVRFSHSSTRWGSCSSNGTISLNIALMKLPFELIDYVIVHELAHTKQMNHSQAFWNIVAAHNPRYKKHRTLLKAQTPSI